MRPLRSKQGHAKSVLHKSNPKLDCDGQQVVVELKGRGMVDCVQYAFLSCAQEEEAARHLLHIIGKVFGRKHGQILIADIGFSQQLGGHTHNILRLLGCVDEHWVPGFDLNCAQAVMGLCRAFHCLVVPREWRLV